MKWKEFEKLALKLLEESKDNKKTIVFNFADNELIYAHKEWIVIEFKKLNGEKPTC